MAPLNPTVVLILQSIAIFGVMHFLYTRVPLLAVIVIVLSGLGAVTNYLVRYHPHALRAPNRTPVGHWFISQVCRLAKEQQLPQEPGRSERAPRRSPPPAPPSEGRSTGARGNTADQTPLPKKAELLLADRHDFVILRENLKDTVRGFDFGVETILARLEQNLRLRTDRTHLISNPPLGAFLLVGPEGVGKRFLAHQLAKGVFRSATVMCIDLCEHPDDVAAFEHVFGSKEPGAIVRAAKEHPHQLVLLENVHLLGERMRARLRQLFAEGYIRDPATGATVKFENMVFVLTTTATEDALATIPHDPSDRSVYNRVASHAVASASGLDEPFLAQVHEILLFAEPTQIEQAEVVALLLERECDLYRLRLDFVDPRVIVEEVAAITPDHGYATLRPRLRNRIRDTIDQARQTGERSVRVDYPPGTKERVYDESRYIG